MSHFKSFFFFYFISFMVLLVIGASFIRFMVTLDFVVSYEGQCDIATQSCYVFCEEDDTECVDPIYYSLVSRSASELVKICGDMSVLECDESMNCQVGETDCVITFCDPEIDTCSEPDQLNSEISL